MIIDNGAFTDIGYNIPPGGESEIETDWEWLYGKLSPGTYKITKKIWTNPKDGDSLSTYTLSAQFMLAGSNGIFRTYEITFDQAWKAAGLSSNMDDYFDPKDAVLVAMK
jgi:hypothetical protein